MDYTVALAYLQQSKIVFFAFIKTQFAPKLNLIVCTQSASFQIRCRREKDPAESDIQMDTLISAY